MPLPGLIWAIICVVMKILTSILNQLRKYWLLSNALHIAIIMNIKLQGKYNCCTQGQPLLQCEDFDLS
jgi:hypothetical protein